MTHALRAGLLALTVALTPVSPVVAHPAAVPAYVPVVKAAIEARWAPHGAGEVRTALRVAKCESHYKPHARHINKNGTVDYGVFQLNSGGTLQSLGLTVQEALNYESNIQGAYRLYRKRGWQPWVCF
jgi:hypothetical protein